MSFTFTKTYTFDLTPDFDSDSLIIQSIQIGAVVELSRVEINTFTHSPDKGFKFDSSQEMTIKATCCPDNLEFFDIIEAAVLRPCIVLIHPSDFDDEPGIKKIILE